MSDPPWSAQQQAALRRVAMIVAGTTSPEEVFATVAAEVGLVLGADFTSMVRYESRTSAAVVAAWATAGRDVVLPVGTRLPVRGVNVHTLVFRTGRPARLDTVTEDVGLALAPSVAAGIRSSVGVPISTEGRLRGAVIVSTTRAERYRLACRRRSAGPQLVRATGRPSRIDRYSPDMRTITYEMGVRAAVAAPITVHPAVLTEAGLAPALKTLARRSSVPVQLDVQTTARLPEHVEVTAYYVVSEALANAAKRASASTVTVDVEAVGGVLSVSVRDNGGGGADLAGGTGLIGLKDRVEAIGRKLTLHSSPGQGTNLVVKLPAG